MYLTLAEVRIDLGETTVIDGLTAEIAGGRVTALAGPSGSGKTTLLAAIAGEIPLTSGHIHRGGGEPESHFAWIPQSPSVLGDRTVIDNVMIGALARGVEIDVAWGMAMRWLEQVGLEHRTRHAARYLSGGEQQRLAFARALVVGAPLILADEPTANLDPHNTQLVCEMLRDISGMTTIIVATHDPQVMKACDAVLALREQR